MAYLLRKLMYPPCPKAGTLPSENLAASFDEPEILSKRAATAGQKRRVQKLVTGGRRIRGCPSSELLCEGERGLKNKTHAQDVFRRLRELAAWAEALTSFLQARGHEGS